ncbi:MAG TPA: CRTAC1 family protein [Pyrinomonadaceae bacterium]|nr:CRTAC1 family protein [Pyrinomonadaceae bacterium]
MRSPSHAIVFALAFALFLSGCKQDPAAVESANQEQAQPASAVPSPGATPTPTPAPRPSGAIEFTDVTAEAGLRFRHNSGASGKKYLPETMGAGAAFLDYDNDGWQDILLVNSTSWPGERGARTTPALYRNRQDGTFQDVTREAGLGVELYGIGCAVGDYDNDGFSDIFITAVGADKLFRNLGDGKFQDVTARAGVGDTGFGTSAAWFDYDADGRLDLFVANYVEWSPETDVHCTLDGTTKSYCTPQKYKGQSATLYRNRGNGTFENATQRAGLFDPTGKSLGVALLDYDADGRLDLFVANDTEPNKLYHNRGNGTFTDEALTAGVAFGETGAARAGMGVDAADYDGSGRQSLVIGNFTSERIALYRNEGGGLFTDEAQASGIGKMSEQSLTFATFFFDYDLDGLLDIFAVNGHVSDDIQKVQPRVRYAQPPHLFRNLGRRKFEEVTARVGRSLARPSVGRGAAYADYDNDGDLDLLVTTNNGPARLFRNDNANQNDVLRVRLIGGQSNRDAIGARVKVTGAATQNLWGMVRTGSSYASQSETTLTFGLGKPAAAEKILALEIVWPSGAKSLVQQVRANQSLVIHEAQGLVKAEPIVFARLAARPQPSPTPAAQP